MAAELPRPGVEVIQVFRSVSPTVITPTLVPCVVGVCKQIVDVITTDASGSSSLNSDANILLPGFFEATAAAGTPPVYGGLNTLSLVLSLNLGPDVTTTFADTAGSGLTPSSVVAQISAAFTTAGVTVAVAETIGVDDDNPGGTSFRIRTVGTGEFQTITVSTASAALVLNVFGIGPAAAPAPLPANYRNFAGVNTYNQFSVNIPQSNFPDPRGNLGELAIEADTIRVFLATGNSSALQEALRDSAFCMNGEVDDAATVEGITDVTAAALYGAAADLDGDTLTLGFDGATPTDLLLDGATNTATEVAFFLAINAFWPDATFTVGGTGGDKLIITSNTTGPSSSIEIVGDASALTDLGLTAAVTTGFNIECIDDGNGDAVSPLIRFEGENFTTAATAAVLTGTAMAAMPAVGSTLIISDGGPPQTVTFEGPPATIAQIVDEINSITAPASGGQITASDFGGGELVLTHSAVGTDSVIQILGGTALAALDNGGGDIVVGFTRGAASLPEPSDELWIDGVFFATVVEVAPGGDVDVIRVDKLVAISNDIGSNFFVEATNLPGVAGRPSPDLVVNLNGDALVKPAMLRDSLGNRVATIAPIYLAYHAVRLDVTSAASNPGLLRFNDTTELADALDPIDASNPLALGILFALLNGPGIQITGLGVGAVSADSPFGTVEGFTAAAEYLEAFEVYGLAPLTHDATVGQVFKTHVDVMSEPESKGERIVLWNPSIPERRLDTLVASGLDGNMADPGGLIFDTGVANLTTLLVAAGINPVGVITANTGLFLDIAANALNYNIASVSGSTVTIRTTFATGENDDDFYTTTDLNDPPLPTSLIQEDFSVKIRGGELTTPTGSLDKNGIAETMQKLGQTFLDRRFWMTFPDAAAATIGGLETLIDGFYLNAAIVGMMGQQPPQQSFTNFPMAGFTRVLGSNDTFTEKQMNIMAAGGTYIIEQSVAGGPLASRMALTTDLTSIETRTDSITKVVDFVAKFLRTGLKNFIGRFNITQGFLDSLGSVLQGLLGFLVETGVLIGANVNNIIQDEDAPDTVLIDVTLDVPFPCNYIRLTLVI